MEGLDSESRINVRRVSALLALLSPFIDLRSHHFPIDHLFPKSRFIPVRLRSAGVNEEQIGPFADYANPLAKLPTEWIDEHFPDEQARRHYRERYYLGDVPRDIANFGDFYEVRRERLKERIYELVNAV